MCQKAFNALFLFANVHQELSVERLYCVIMCFGHQGWYGSASSEGLWADVLGSAGAEGMDEVHPAQGLHCGGWLQSHGEYHQSVKPVSEPCRIHVNVSVIIHPVDNTSVQVLVGRYESWTHLLSLTKAL